MPRRQDKVGSGLEQRLLRWLSKYARPAPATILVGFSGGVDSLALAIALGHVDKAIESSILLVHIDHAMRPNSADQAGEALAYADRIGLPIRTVRLQKDVSSRHRGAGPEEAARRERFLAFSKLSSEFRGAPIMTAHQADDQAETVLLHLLRGSGLSGLGGMKETTTLEVPWWTPAAASSLTYALQIWRPFLGEKRRILATYLDEQGWSPIEDETNETLAYARNRVRHRLLPIAEAVQPGATDAVTRFARIAAVDNDFLDDAMNNAFADCGAKRTAIPLSCFANVHPALSSRYVHQWLASMLHSAPTADRVGAVLDLIESRNPSLRIEVGQDLVVWIAQGTLVASSKNDQGALP